MTWHISDFDPGGMNCRPARRASSIFIQAAATGSSIRGGAGQPAPKRAPLPRVPPLPLRGEVAGQAPADTGKRQVRASLPSVRAATASFPVSVTVADRRPLR